MPGNNSMTRRNRYRTLVLLLTLVATATCAAQTDSTTSTFTIPDRNTSRLLVTPTARPLKAGQGYVALSELFFPIVVVGATDWLSAGGGISLIPTTDRQIVYGTAKITPYRADKVAVAAGLLYIVGTGDIIDEPILLPFVVTTFGSDDHAMTLGFGRWISRDSIDEDLALSIGAETRVSNNVKLLGESWIPTFDRPAYILAGVRFFGKRVSADLAVITSTELFAARHRYEFPAVLPLISFAYNFGE